MIKLLIAIWVSILLSLDAWAGSGVVWLQHGRDGFSRIINETPYYLICYIQFRDRGAIYWELNSNTATPWWQGITYWECE